MVSVPRVVVAAPASGQGKTSLATGLLAAFRARGFEVSPHKVGPDYIDPGYHTLAAGRPGRNLDPWLVGEERIVPMFEHGATTPRAADIAIIEGVMGLFDGASARGEFASTAHVARLLAAPIILVVDASGVARSVGALVHGFASFDPSVRIGGVVFNRVGSDGHAAILREAVEPMGIPVLGMIHRQGSLAVPSRHLGLVPAAERSAEAVAVVEELGRVMAASVDLEAVLRLARTAGDLPGAVDVEQVDPPTPHVRIAVAAGSAFTFGYAEHPELLRAAGAEVVSFDPLTDEQLPPDVDGLVIGGGFPEVHAVDLSANVPLRTQIAELARSGAPVIAECAGLLYLGRSLDGHEMCGVLDSDAVMTDRLTLGYREAVAPADSVLVSVGTRVRGHEFHRTSVTAGTGVQPAWQWRLHRETVSEGVVQDGVHASYLHVHWAGIPGAAERIVAACRPASERGVVTDLALLTHHGDQDVPPGLIDLAVNVRVGGAPAWLAERIAAADLTAYPDQTQAITAVAARHGRARDEVLLTAGAAEAFVLIARALRPRHAVVVHPQFTEPEVALRAAGHPVAQVVLGPPFALDPARVPDNADLVVVGNPTNPTSVVHPRQVVRALVRPGRIVVVDEAFADCVPGEAQSLAGDADLSGLVVVRSLTKTWGLAGLRVGYLLAADNTVRELRRAQPAWPVSSPALAACVACSSAPAVHEAQQWTVQLARCRGTLVRRLASIPGVQVVPGAGASFVLVETPRHDVRLRLHDKGFAVRRGETFPGLGPNWIRIAVRDDGTSAAFAAALEETLT